jgi:hypothetical protein
VGVYKRFEDNDILQSTIHARPRILLASGSQGWHGNTGPNGSLSLYAGIRARTDVKQSDFGTSGLSIYPIDPLDTHSIDRVIYVSGSYPSTGNVAYVKCRNTPASNFTQITDQFWYEEHYRPIELLYEYYSRYNPERFIGYHDYYSLYFQQNQSYSAPVVSYTGSGLSTMTSSYTVEAWIKPTFVTSSAQDYVVMGQRGRWKLYVTGASGKLAFTDFATIVTSSVALTPGIWTHVAFVADGASGSFYLNSSLDGRTAFTGSLAAWSAATTGAHLTVGAAYVLSGASNVVQADHGFRGFLYETKVWSTSRSASQISGTWNRTLKPSESGSSTLLHYSRFNDGPLAYAHGYTQGSGAFDYGRSGVHGRMINFRTVLPLSPTWQPNDNVDFYTYKTQLSSTGTAFFRAVHVPSLYYGRQIATGSLVIECHAYENQGLVRTIKDDGRGGLYISGSLCRPIGNEDYEGVKWRKVGDIFYSEGIIVITDPSLWDLGETNLDATRDADVFRLTFDGLERVPTKVFMCQLPGAEFNASNNPTFSSVDPGDPEDLTDDRHVARTNVTYVTAVGIYDEHRNLVAVAKLAQPIRKREMDRLTIRLKMDL